MNRKYQHQCVVNTSMNRKYQHILSFDTNGTMMCRCVKTQDDAGIYDSCWYLRFMLVFTIHAGIYGVPIVSKLKMMLVFTIHAGINDSCWYLRSMLVFTFYAGIVNTSVRCKYRHES